MEVALNQYDEFDYFKKVSVTSMDPQVSVNNLRLKFPGEADLIFRDLSISIATGEKVLLLGPSGCGKSTLLQVFSGLIPDSIEVPLKYETIKLPAYWGFVFQDPDTQFCMPFVDEELAFVLENLQTPREEMDNAITQALDTVGLGDLPIHTQIDDLSQGMKQRLALASVLLLDPDVLFLDEPSALLDPEGTDQIWESVKNVADDKTVIIVEHKIDKIADWVDRVILFNHHGEIIADGVPNTIFSTHKAELIEFGIWYPGVWDDYLASNSYLALRENRKSPSLQDAVITLDDFSGYRGKKEMIHVPEAQVKQGAWLTIIGDNGAGKSTLLLALMQLLPTSGHYELNETLINYDKKNKSIPNGISFVFQNPELQFITNSIFDELAFSYQLHDLSEAEIAEKVHELLVMFEINVNEKRHPFQLSTGQKRRLSVATAFAHGAKILLLDEPTFGQDAKNTFIMLEQLERLRVNGTTIIMVTHDESIVENFATDVWTISDGKLIQTAEQNEGK